MSNLFSKFWLSRPGFFDPVQYLSNGNFWDEFLKRFGSYTRGTVVDLACGTGELRKHISPAGYLGIDLNREYISLAEKRFRSKNTKFRVGDILKQEISNPDTVFFISAAHHLSDDQIRQLAESMNKSRVKRFVLVDGYPIGPFSKALSYLDHKLGGGKYFRKDKELVSLIRQHLTISESGEFSAKASLYRYPFLVATAINP